MSWTDARYVVLSSQSDALLRAHGCSQSTVTSGKSRPGLESPVARRALRQMRSNDHVRLEPLLAQKCGGEDRKQRFDSKRGKLDFSVSVSGFQHFLASVDEIRWTKRKSGRISGRDFRRQNGVLAQLVERLNGIEEVRGSIPLGSRPSLERQRKRRSVTP